MSEKDPEIISTVRRFRKERGWSQEDLARLAGVGRQAVYDMESGRYLPNTAVALRLAQLFACRVEDLFLTPEARGLRSLFLAGGEAAVGSRLALGRVRERLVGWPLGTNGHFSFNLRAADGLLESAEAGVAGGEGPVARLLASAADIENNLLVLGCDPALEVLGSHLEHLLPAARAHCFFASSKKALAGVAAGCAHVAATHFHNGAASGAGSEAGPEANVAAARASMPSMPCRVIGFSLVEEGIMVGRGNPLRIRKVGDLANPDLRFVNREEGAALRRLLEDELVREGVPASFIPGFEHCVRSHGEGAARVACGAADAALGLRLVAEAYGLHFIPLAATRCDLVIPLDLEDSPPLTALLDVLQSARLRREMASLPGYEAVFAGKEIAVLP